LFSCLSFMSISCRFCEGVGLSLSRFRDLVCVGGCEKFILSPFLKVQSLLLSSPQATLMCCITNIIFVLLFYFFQAETIKLYGGVLSRPGKFFKWGSSAWFIASKSPPNPVTTHTCRAEHSSTIIFALYSYCLKDIGSYLLH